MSATGFSATDYLQNASPYILATPFTVGLWSRIKSGSSRTLWWLGDTGSGNTLNRWAISTNNTPQWQMSASTSSAGTNDVGGTVTFNQWAFGVFRFISATNRKGDIWQGDGSIGQISGATSRVPTATPNLMAFGAAVGNSPGLTMDGFVGEYWITNTDIQPDGAALKADTLRQLAFGGPFSIPHIAKDILEYRSFRKGLTTDSDDSSETYFSGDLKTWTAVGGPTLGFHPPLPSWYVRPNQNIRNLTV